MQLAILWTDDQAAKKYFIVQGSNIYETTMLSTQILRNYKGPKRYDRFAHFKDVT